MANLSLVVLSVYTGIAQGSQPLVSRAWGQGRAAEGRRVLRYALTCALVFAAVVYAVFFFGTGPIAAIFNSEADPALQRMAEQGLRLYFLALPFAAVNVVLATYFASIEQAGPAQAVSLLRGVVIIVPAALALSALFALPGVWLAFPVSEAIVAVVAVALLVRGRKPEKV